MQHVINAGGPDRVSRVHMAESVALHRGYSFSLIKSASASSVCSPLSTLSSLYLSITNLCQEVVTCESFTKWQDYIGHALLMCLYQQINNLSGLLRKIGPKIEF